jgi:hypothetical protein
MMKKRIIEINNAHYGVGNVSCEPSIEEIQKAIQENDLETRSFQTDLTELNAEWNRKANNEDEYYALQKKYHSRRIAFFIVNGWADPILLYKDGCKIKDGLHRFKAAIYLKMEVIDVITTS